MGIFAFVLIAAAIVLPFAYLVNKRVQEHAERKLELEARIEEAKAQQAALPNETQQHLEDRMRVLERIVTDPSTDLSRQIENLRELSNEGEAAR
ncbi:hypothetical protein D6201_00785 [Aurantiacibacter aquimixticola]|uniref:Uncharacterized protein n=2 Tax=Aurantiacibacter aquimixticola TaxID=1958945 RepID=A0A419RWD9_9SPHN|nr:hypothetical protein D6201_00785 [Aurantiacibacter aquimixticola]